MPKLNLAEVVEKLKLEWADQPFNQGHQRKQKGQRMSLKEQMNYANLQVGVKPGYTVTQDHSIIVCEKFGVGN